MLKIDLDRPLSVGQLSYHIKSLLEGSFSYVKVRGELSGVKRHTSGHLYCTLRDQEASLDVVCWRGTKLSLSPEDGLEVIAAGRLTSYPPRSRYQLIMTHMSLAGLGELLKRVEALKNKFKQEGLFDPNRKKPLPCFPEKIGVITSETGAVIQDILHRLKERYPCQVVLWPVCVQGVGAEEQIAMAIKGVNTMAPQEKPDVLILARGGGSPEDLMPFNHESVVYAVAESDLPIITGVGHETDTTLVDYVADVRAPTPTAAAEIATPVVYELLEHLQNLARRLTQHMRTRFALQETQLAHFAQPLSQFKTYILLKEQVLDDMLITCERALRYVYEEKALFFQGTAQRLCPPALLIASKKHSFTTLIQQILHALHTKYLRKQTQFQQLEQLLISLSYKKTLARGYVIVRQHTHPESKTPTIVAYAKHFVGKKSLELEFQDAQLSLVPCTAESSKTDT